MASISATDTKPEISVRSFLFKKGYRFRKNVRTLPGKPDIVLTKFRTVIFVNGCFWHGHNKCTNAKLPRTNRAFWTAKIESNKERDKRITRQLRKNGWSVLVVWQCKIRNKAALDLTIEKLINRLEIRRQAIRLPTGQ